MKYLIGRGFTRLAAVAGTVATMGAALALASAPASATESNYCGGKVLTNFETCFGATREVREVRGWGNEKSVCVGVDSLSGKCSSGPGVVAIMNYGQEFIQPPWIQDNAAGKTTVWGEAYT